MRLRMIEESRDKETIPRGSMADSQKRGMMSIGKPLGDKCFT